VVRAGHPPAIRPRAALLLGVAVLTGCATYSDHLRAAHRAAERGDWPAAEASINAVIGVDSRDELPEVWSSNQSLAVLERAIVLQAQDAWKPSARDLSAAESQLEIIDLKLDTVGKIGSYVYSDSAQEYRAPPVEEASLNAFNMLNYLALADLQGAAVEARRYQVIRNYLETLGKNHPQGRLGAYLAGFVFEKLGEAPRALRYYQDAQGQGSGDLHSLDAAVKRGGAPPRRKGELLIVIAGGRTPIKVPKRIPVGAAIGIAGTWITGNTDILERSVFKVVVYPELENVPSEVRGGKVHINGRQVQPELLADIAAEVRTEYEMLKPRILGAALSRMIVRAGAAEGARAAGNQAGSVLGTLAALGTEAVLVGLDRPDTRSWTFLPGRVWVARAEVDPGSYEIVVELEGVGATARRAVVEVEEGGYAAVVATAPR